MRRQDKAKEIGDILDKLYPETLIPLDHFSAYTLLVAVMLSAQTTDKKVNQVTPKLFKLAKVPEEMAALDLETIRNTIKEIGLAPTKAKNLKKMAKQLIDSGGMRPDWDFLESLAGVGHKTASVVMSQWYGFLHSLLTPIYIGLQARWGLSKAKNVEMTERDLKRLWSKENGIKGIFRLYFLDANIAMQETII